jgi:16S rRNA (adenine1518-N6/adenine1519-N6)-dimethyltransferase
VRLVLLVQQEVGQRLRARPGSSAYGALSVRMQLLARCSSVCTVPPGSFSPPPKVTSEVVVLDPLPPDRLLPQPLALAVDRLVTRCFTARRKMLRNSLGGLVAPERLRSVAEQAGIDLSQRPQDLPGERWVALARALSEEQGGGTSP